MKIAKKENEVKVTPEMLRDDEVPKEIKEMQLNFAILNSMRQKERNKKEKAEFNIEAYQMGMDMIEEELKERGYGLE